RRGERVDEARLGMPRADDLEPRRARSERRGGLFDHRAVRPHVECRVLRRERDGRRSADTVLGHARDGVADERGDVLHPRVHAGRASAARELGLERRALPLDDARERRAAADRPVAGGELPEERRRRRGAAADVRVVRLDLVEPRRRSVRHEQDALAHRASQSAASSAKYVMITSAPARAIAVSDSSAARRRSIHPRSAAAWSEAYSPLTWYAASGTSKRARAAAMTSRYGPAGFTISASAPSSRSLRISRSASRPFGGSIW